MDGCDDREVFVEAKTPVLSPRQAACLSLAARGRTSPKIAQALGISPRTVDQYIALACARLNVHTRVQAVAKALVLGLLPDGPPP
jgi:DNA-binding CsgD family transcriptional regulator